MVHEFQAFARLFAERDAQTIDEHLAISQAVMETVDALHVDAALPFPEMN